MFVELIVFKEKISGRESRKTDVAVAQGRIDDGLDRIRAVPIKKNREI